MLSTINLISTGWHYGKNKIIVPPPSPLPPLQKKKTLVEFAILYQQCCHNRHVHALFLSSHQNVTLLLCKDLILSNQISASITICFQWIFDDGRRETNIYHRSEMKYSQIAICKKYESHQWKTFYATSRKAQTNDEVQHLILTRRCKKKHFRGPTYS